MNDITKQLSKNIYTRSDFYRQVALLKEFFEYSFFSKSLEKPTKKTLKAFLKEKESNEFKNYSHAILGLNDEFFEQFNKENFYRLFKESESDMEAFPVVVLYVPVSFSQKETTLFGVWFRENFDKNIFLDIKVDSSIIAGCMFVWKNTHYDLSFKKILNEKRDEIAKMINSLFEKKV
jgi:F0F1-type ATP synthase delta subunit